MPANRKKKADTYTAAVILYDMGRAYGRTTFDRSIPIGDSTTLAQVVSRLKAIKALPARTTVASVKQDEREWPYRLSIVNRRTGDVMVELNQDE